MSGQVNKRQFYRVECCGRCAGKVWIGNKYEIKDRILANLTGEMSGDCTWRLNEFIGYTLFRVEVGDLNPGLYLAVRRHALSES
jgi:hypothetical protein